MTSLDFAMVLPPGWVRIPIDRAEADFAALVRSVVEQVPQEKALAVRTFMETQLSVALAAAREHKAREFIIPLAPVLDVAVPASITVTTVATPATEKRSPQEILVSLAGRDAATAIEIDGLVGIRRSRTVAAGSDGGVGLPADTASYRSISYICHLPWSDEWVTFTASILTADIPDIDDQLEVVEALMDVMVSTVRFARVNDEATA